MYRDKKVIHIVATGLNGEIGKGNKLLWSIPAELKHFRDSTLGNVVLIGRVTYDSLPNKLDRRVVLRVSGKPSEDSFGYGFKRDFESYLQEAEHISDEILNTNCIFVAGGSKLYKSTEPYVDEIWKTQIFKTYDDADSFYSVPEGFEVYQQSSKVLMQDKIKGFDCGVYVQFLKFRKV